MTSFVRDPIQQRMATSLRQTIRRITKDTDGLREIVNSHYLKGTFIQLCHPDTMKELLFPGASLEVLRNLPKNLKEILEWSDLQLDLEKIARNATEVLTNIKVKGAKQGNVMDDATERVLLPQIAQEALSKGIIEAVRKLNVKVSATIAKIARPVASVNSDRTTKNNLEDEFYEQYSKHHYATQSMYVGKDWSELIRNDLRRFIAREKMSTINDNGEVIVKDENIKVEELPAISFSSMAWIEKDEKTQAVYPALFELIDQMQSLPYEFNAKLQLGALKLLEPSKGCTMLIYYPVGSCQRIRIDNRGGEYDSGIRMSCAIHIQNNLNLVRSIDKRSAKLILTENKNSAEIILEDDMLVVHSATEMMNERGADDEQDWFAVVFFIHGKDCADGDDSLS